VRWLYLGKDPKLAEGRVSFGEYRAVLKHLEELRRRRERLLRRVEEAMRALG